MFEVQYQLKCILVQIDKHLIKVNILLKHKLKLNYKLLVNKMFQTIDGLRMSNSVRIKILILNFQFNVMVTLQADIFEYIEDFFKIILESFDDFDIRVKNAAEMMNWFIQEQITVQSEAFKNSQNDLLREILKYVEKTDNYQVKLLVIEWVYLVDALPKSMLYNQVKAIVPKLLFMLHRNKYEIRSLVLRKLEKLFREIRLSHKPLTRVKDVLNAICKYLNRFFAKKKKSVEMFHLFKTVLESFEFSVSPERVRELGREEREKIPQILKKIFNMCLDEFTQVFFVQKMRNTLNTQLKRILQNVDFRKGFEELEEELSKEYLNYATRHSIKDLYLLKEVHSVRSLVLLRAPVRNDSPCHLSQSAQIFLQVLSNNKVNYKKRRFKIFLIEKIPLLISSIFRSQKMVEGFYKKVLTLALQSQKNYAITDEIKYCLLLMSSPSLSIVTIFDILSARHLGPKLSSGFALKFFLIMKKNITENIRQRFIYDCFDPPQNLVLLKECTELDQDLMTRLEAEGKFQSSKEMIEVFQALSQNPDAQLSSTGRSPNFAQIDRIGPELVKKSIFDILLENPFSTIMLCVIFSCYHFATELIKHLVFFYGSTKSISQQDRFIEELEKVFKHLLSILRIPRHFEDVYLIRLIKLVCVLIPQNNLFFVLKKRLKFMKQIQIKAKTNHQHRKDEEMICFKAYITSSKFFQQK